MHRHRSLPPRVPVAAAGAAILAVIGTLLGLLCLGSPAHAQGFTLALRQDTPVDSLPGALAMGDFNRDGNVDLAVANRYTNTVSVLLGAGDGSFGPKTTIPTGVNPVGVAIADLNRDSIPDIAVLCAGDSAVYVYLRTNLGDFRSRVRVPTHVNPTAIALALLNGDAVPDLVVTEQSAGKAAVWLGNGDGSFGPPAEYDTHPSPMVLVTADVNHDGNIDIVTANGDGTLTFLTGDGVGKFATPVPLIIGSVPAAIAAGDVNGDGFPDLVTIFAVGSAGVAWLTNVTGAFSQSKSFATISGPLGVALGDVSGDGLADVIVANGTQKRLTLLLGDGTGNFGGLGKVLQVDAPGYPQAAAVADLDHDGVLDLLATTNFKDGASTFLANGAGEFSAAVTYRTGMEPGQVLLRDLNGDNHLDAVTVDYASNAISVLLGNGTGAFAPRTQYPTGVHPAFADFGDITGDGKTDLVVTNNGSGSVSVLSGDGGGGFGPAVEYSLGGDLGPFGIGVGNFDADGKPDVAVVVAATEKVNLLKNNGSGGLIAPGTPFPSGPGAWGLAVADMNGDSHPDVLTADFSGVAASVMLGDGAGSLGLHTDFPVSNPGEWVSIGDVTGDGKLDAVVSGGGGILSVLPGDGAGGFTLPRFDLTTGASPYNNVVVDVNGDGRLDIVTADLGDNAVSVHRTGKGALGANVEYPTGPNPQGVAAGDLDGDGRIDLVAVNSQDSTMAVLLQRSATRTTLTPSPAACQLGDMITLTAHVQRLDASPVTGVPTGSVRFFDGLTPLGTASLAAGVASLPFTTQRAWHRAYRAVYLGDDRHKTSGSETLDYLVSIVTGVPASGRGSGLALEAPRPNPARGGEASVTFTLPSAGPARIDVFDVRGRRVLAQDVGSLGAGPHTIPLALGTGTAPGVYVVRLSQGAAARTARLVVLRGGD